MGNWYTNVSLEGVNPADVLSHMNALGRVAIITPSVANWLVVFDQECDKFDLDALESLALTLSTRLHCTAVACFNADDDVLWFAIYENGERTSRYASSPGEFEDRNEFPSLAEFASALCRVFKKPERLRRARSILRRGRGILGLLTLIRIHLAYVVEIQRHQDLATLLDLPSASVGLGYTYVSRGELALGMDSNTLLRTSGAIFG
ncbi:MAG: hypothetical protein WBQ89_24890 [Candidatus Acidiferrum sp.]